MDAQLEDKFTLSRQTIFNLLQASSAFNPQVVKVFIDVFKDLPDCRQHGPIVWALMVKGEGVKRGVLGTHLKVYLQYYYHYLISASQRRECRRPLDIPSLAYLTAVAAFGFARGSTEFDKAFNNRDIDYINNLIIDRESFLKFFWDQSDDNFSFIHCWRLIDRLWDAWDIPAPVRIHGFVSSNLSERMLKARIGVIGAFLLRFSSKGGLAVDYVHEGKIKKTHWKFDELRDVNSLRARLYDSKRDGPFLLHTIDFTDPFSAKCYRKEDLFPAMHVESGYSDSGYTGDGYNAVDAMPIEETTNKQFVGMNMKWT